MERYPGYYYVYCDVCGRKVKNTEVTLVKDKYNTQNGLLVCNNDVDKTNPQVTIRVVKDKIIPDPKYIRSEPPNRYATYRTVNEIETGVDETDPSGDAPSAPRNLRLYEFDLTANTLDLIWDFPLNMGSSNITGYKIERDDNGSGFVTIKADTSSPAAYYRDTSITNDNIYTYRVSAINSNGTSGTSNEFVIQFGLDTVNILVDDVGNFITDGAGNIIII